MHQTQSEELLTSIRRLTHAIPRDVGIYAGYSEGCHPERAGETVTHASVYVEIDGKPRVIQASTHPKDGELSLQELRDELVELIGKHKREVA
ncbi:hypothetical protein [uncultured Halomonas sp.]|uniref:hypothetical protein n=1 Tax=uncultured Halomonas sp. TaxID=173971 RepID=UPI002631A494|nr:hypothetical protein [uncultured Halomonas sp.]